MDLIKQIGDTLTTVDRAMAQIYYQMTAAKGSEKDRLQQRYNSLEQQRKHLDEQQRTLVKRSFDESTTSYQQLTDSLEDANSGLETTLTKLADLSNALNIANQIIGGIDQILQFVATFMTL
jgi:chromosome segregation ATPase